MKFPLSWLADYIDLTLPLQQIARLLTMAGIEVEGMESMPAPFKGVVVGKIKAVSPHPSSERLSVVTVHDGHSAHQVVCGAPNCLPGVKSAFAPVGSTVAGRVIEKRSVSGVDSFGMLCSAKELDLSSEGGQIIEFDDHLSEGADLTEIYADTLIEVAITPNLNHCANLIGIARELAAATEGSVRLPSVALQEGSGKVGGSISVTVEEELLCPRYTCRIINAVQIGPSPHWMQKRLSDAGMRPVNNVVDSTNYVLLESGQPLHAFDYEQLRGSQITVRLAKEGERLTTLDGKDRLLSIEDLVICDEVGPVALAGVMGGKESEVGAKTRHILLEAAYFSPVAVRRMSKRAGVQTESSRRFERGTDPNGPLWALDRAAQLIQMTGGGELLTAPIDSKKREFLPKKIPCRLDRINALLGTRLSLSEVEKIFQRLGFSFEWDGKGAFVVEPPTYRCDLQEEIDLVEEVARLWGYANIPKTPGRYQTSALPHVPIYLFEREVTDRFIAEGLQELLTCDLIGPSLLDAIGFKKEEEASFVKVLNPTSIEQSILRSSLLPGLLQVARHNIDRGVTNIRGFEVGRIHFREERGYKERSFVGILLTGRRSPLQWAAGKEEVDFYDIKGIIENFLRGLGLFSPTFVQGSKAPYHPGRQAVLQLEGREIGVLGEVHPAVLRRLDISQRVLFAEIDLQELLVNREIEGEVEPVPIYPASSRDWTITLDERVRVGELLEEIKHVRSSLLESVVLLDLYRSAAIGAKKKNASFRFVYRDREKTLSQEKVEAEHAKIVEQCQKFLNKECV